MPGSRHNASGAKPKNVRKTLARISGYIFQQKFRFFTVLFFILISSSANVAGTYFIKPLLNQCIAPLVGKKVTPADFIPFIQMIAVMGCIYAIGVLSSLIYSQLMIKISNGTLNAVRRDLFNKMQDLPIKYFDTHTHGELMSRYTSDVDTLREAITMGVTQLLGSTITVVGTFIMMLVLSPILTLLIVVMLLIMFTIIKKVGGMSAKYFKKQQAAIGAANGYIEEMIEGQKVVKVFCHEDKVKKEFDTLNENLRQAATSANYSASVLMPTMGNLGYVNYALTAVAGAVLVISGWMDIGSIASFLQYTRTFNQPITMISQQLNTVFAALAGAERIFEVIDEQPESDDGYVTLVNAKKDAQGNLTETAERTGLWAWKHPHHDGAVTYTQLNGDVRLHDVTFGYEPDKTVLHDISLYAEPGQKIAFVGSTGAGKTTITNLLNRFYEVPEGKIRYDGINITKIKKDDLRRSLAMVLQDTHLFTGTVRENIRYGRLDATDEEIVAAAKLANADSFIRHLPNGYDTMLTSDGTNLSQGQRQLLAIARAAVANPPVLILDEATSSIDTRTEALIEKGMDKLMNGRTVFVIAHRLSTVRNSNAIMVLENG
ncbi:MAG TPA: ABC transporter ATP-binding protein, partial [Caproiciproducens sp.]|nr:ABC transporter ATP-binding protein [Caproiciproducens sp.]